MLLVLFSLIFTSKLCPNKDTFNEHDHSIRFTYVFLCVDLFLNPCYECVCVRPNAAGNMSSHKDNTHILTRPTKQHAKLKMHL